MNTNDDNREKDAAKGEPVPLQPIIDMGSTVVKSSRGTVYCLTIVGQVEGHTLLPDNTKTTKYEHVLPLLAALEQSEQVEGLLLLLNTVGGDIEAGLALAELIAGMTKPTVSLVLGGGHSIGVPLAVAAKKSFIASTATMTIHPVRINGLVLGVPQAFTYFQRMQERITTFVTSNSHMSPKRFTELCMNTDELATDVGSVLDGEDAVKEGLIDGLGSLSDAIGALNTMIDENRAKQTEEPAAHPAD